MVLAKNFSPLVLLLSLSSVFLYYIWCGQNAWGSLLAVLIAVPFGLLFFYAAFTCIVVFYDRSIQKLRAAALAEVRRKRRHKQYAEAAAFLKTVRRQHFQVAFWSVLVLILIGTVIVLIPLQNPHLHI